MSRKRSVKTRPERLRFGLLFAKSRAENMGTIDKDIRELREKTGRTRYQFLRAELQTCFTALEMGRYELSVGNATVAEREVAAVETGIRAIQRFLPESIGGAKKGSGDEAGGAQ